MTTLGYLRGVREWVYPMRTTSAFLEKGVLTPEEFVRAGDELVFRCPTWSWESGDESKQRSYLPPNKQYLITRNVPCLTRVDQLEQELLLKLQKQEQKKKRSNNNNNNNTDDDDDTEDDAEWLLSTLSSDNDHKNSKILEDDFDIVDETGEILERPPVPIVPEEKTAETYDDDDDDAGGYADMADYEDDNVYADQDAIVHTTTATTTTGKVQDNLLKVRTYDMSITYDKYYQTPRVWMTGTSALGQPLTAVEMMQDVMTDYANKTVTIEHHPHLAGYFASIHPCQHGKVMQRIVHNLIRANNNNKQQEGDHHPDGGGSGGEPTVEMYLFIFLKFVNSIIPTINYDFTMDVTASTQKM